MEVSKLLGNIGTGNVWRVVAIGMIVVLVVLGAYALEVKGERNVLAQTVVTKEAEITTKVKEVEFMTAWMARDKLDAQAKDAEYNRTMAAKPKYVTQIKYVPTGEKCADYEAIINEARANQEATR